MSTTIAVDENNRELNELLDRVEAEGRITLERDGRAVALLSPALDLLGMIRKIHEGNLDIPSDDIEREIDLAVREVRAELAAERRQHVA